MDPITWVLVATNAVTVATILRMRLKCRHEWGAWSGWTANERPMSTVTFVRVRACSKCGELQEGRTGVHKCFGPMCIHIKPFIEAMDDEARRIKRLEKDLGL